MAGSPEISPPLIPFAEESQANLARPRGEKIAEKVKIRGKNASPPFGEPPEYDGIDRRVDVSDSLVEDSVILGRDVYQNLFTCYSHRLPSRPASGLEIRNRNKLRQEKKLNFIFFAIKKILTEKSKRHSPSVTIESRQIVARTAILDRCEPHAHFCPFATCILLCRGGEMNWKRTKLSDWRNERVPGLGFGAPQPCVVLLF